MSNQQPNGWAFVAPYHGLNQTALPYICIQGSSIVSSGSFDVGGSLTITGSGSSGSLNVGGGSLTITGSEIPNGGGVLTLQGDVDIKKPTLVPLEEVEQPMHMCAICHDTEIDTEWRRPTKCRHEFHKNCLMAHIEAQQQRKGDITCPMCRERMVNVAFPTL